MTPPPRDGRCALGVLRLGVALLGVTAVAGLWELIAAQVPGSPLYIGVLPGPIGTLRELALSLALLALAAHGLWARAFGADSEGRRARLALGLLAAGALLAIASQAYAAGHGMHGHQMSDLRLDARAVFYLRHGGLLLFALGWLAVGLGVVRRPSAT